MNTPFDNDVNKGNNHPQLKHCGQCGGYLFIYNVHGISECVSCKKTM